MGCTTRGEGWCCEGWREERIDNSATAVSNPYARRRLGTARIRAVKVKEGTCNVPKTLQDKIQEVSTLRRSRFLFSSFPQPHTISSHDTPRQCYPSITDASFDESSFSSNITTIAAGTVTSNALSVPYLATADASWYSPLTKLVYPGGGQVIDLDNDLANVTKVWDDVKATDWIDSSTRAGENGDDDDERSGVVISLVVHLFLSPAKPLNLYFSPGSRAVFVNLNFYNANVDLVSATKFSIEFSSAGAIFTSSQIRCLPLIRPLRVLLGDGATSMASLTLTLELVFFGMVVMYILNEVRVIRIKGLAYLKNFWNQVRKKSLCAVQSIVWSVLHIPNAAPPPVRPSSSS